MFSIKKLYNSYVIIIHTTKQIQFNLKMLSCLQNMQMSVRDFKIQFTLGFSSISNDHNSQINPYHLTYDFHQQNYLRSQDLQIQSRLP